MLHFSRVPMVPTTLETQMGMLKRFEEHADLLSAMMRRTGVKLDESGGYMAESLLRQAITACYMCRDGKACRAWLAEAEQGLPPPDFCPNKKLLEALSRRDAFAL
jgi:hypothetical protein